MAFLRVASSLVLWHAARATDFLGQREQVTKELVEQTLEELATDTVRLAAIEQELSPMFAALPKNEQGRLEPSTVRYAMHRYFVEKHGWYVEGLSSSGSVANSSSATILTEMAPAFIQARLETQMHNAGMRLQDLAIFAATLSDLVHNEGVKHLHAVYNILRLPTASDVSVESFTSAVRGYLAATIVGFGATLEGASGLAALETEARDVYAEYDDLLMWFEDSRLTRNFLHGSSQSPFKEKAGISPDEADELMRDLYHKFGSLQNLECVALKQKLVEAEYPGTGRVSLASFYRDPDYQLHESVAYLRNQGTLDEGTAGNPAIVIPNYMASPGRCMPFSSYFSVCCPDDCERVLGRIEEAVAEPTAEPKRIADIVSMTRSETQDAPRNLSTALVARLDEIANRHHGRVPLHGRLFMQWLHHAYPHDCPYPHVSGTYNLVTQDEWILMHEDIDDVRATESEKQLHAASSVLEPDNLEPLPWTDVEELVAVDTAEAQVPGRSKVREFMMVVAVLSFVIPLVRSSAALMGAQREGKEQMHLV